MSETNIHKVAILAFDGMVPADLTSPCEVLGLATLNDGHQPYAVYVCGYAPRIKTQAFDLQVKWGLDQLEDADTVIIPGLANPAAEIPLYISEAITKSQLAGARIVSICTGAFVLAASGLLDGLEATTHWKAAGLFASLYPKVKLHPNVLYTDNGQVLTSAGASAGIDLCLHLIRKDYGAQVATNAARLAVVPLERAGGQAQFIVQTTPTISTSLAPLLQWVEERLEQTITLDDMAEFASISIRTLNRRFQEQLQISPLQWVIQARLRQAQCMLERSDLSIEQVAEVAGFGSSASLREHFSKSIGTSPNTYRQAFRKKHR